jgi:hypothetical protein
VFGNFPPSVTSGLKEGTTAGSCTPALQVGGQTNTDVGVQRFNMGMTIESWSRGKCSSAMSSYYAAVIRY